MMHRIISTIVFIFTTMNLVAPTNAIPKPIIYTPIDCQCVAPPSSEPQTTTTATTATTPVNNKEDDTPSKKKKMTITPPRRRASSIWKSSPVKRRPTPTAAEYSKEIDDKQKEIDDKRMAMAKSYRARQRAIFQNRLYMNSLNQVNKAAKDIVIGDW